MAREAIEHPEVADIRADRLTEAAGRMRAVLTMIADGNAMLCWPCCQSHIRASNAAAAARMLLEVSE